MKLLNLFGIGKNKLLGIGTMTEATVTAVRTCYWLKVNTKPFRKDMMDGARFPHIITYTYTAKGETFTGEAFINWNLPVPAINSKISVCYDPENPSRCVHI